MTTVLFSAQEPDALENGFLKVTLANSTERIETMNEGHLRAFSLKPPKGAFRKQALTIKENNSRPRLFYQSFRVL